MQFTFKSKFLSILVILTSIVLPAEGKIGKPKTLNHSNERGFGYNQVTQVIFSGSAIITSSNGMAKLWNRNGNLLRTIQHKESTTHVNFSHDGNIIATASDNVALLQDWNGAQLATLKHEDRVNHVAFNNNSTMVATASNDGTVKIWTSNGTLCATLQHEKEAQYAAFSHNSTMIATVSRTSANFGGILRVWTSGGKLLYTHQISIGYPADYSLAFSHNDSMINYRKKIWDQNGNLLFEAPYSTESCKRPIIFSSDNSFIVTASDASGKRAIGIFSLNGELVSTLKHNPPGSISQRFNIKDVWNYHAALSHDNTMIATTIDDYSVRIWDKNGNLLHVLQHCNRIINKIKGDYVELVFFSDDNRLATVASDNTVKIWDLKKK